MAQSVVLMEPSNPADVWTVPGSTVDLERGDFVSFESGVAVLMDADTEDATFAGFMLNQYDADKRVPQQVVLALVGMLQCAATSATYNAFDALKYTAKNTVVADGSANTIAWAAKDYASASTSIRVYINVPALAKLFAVSA